MHVIVAIGVSVDVCERIGTASGLGSSVWVPLGRGVAVSIGSGVDVIVMVGVTVKVAVQVAVAVRLAVGATVLVLFAHTVSTAMLKPQARCSGRYPAGPRFITGARHSFFCREPRAVTHARSVRVNTDPRSYLC